MDVRGEIATTTRLKIAANLLHGNLNRGLRRGGGGIVESARGPGQTSRTKGASYTPPFLAFLTIANDKRTNFIEHILRVWISVQLLDKKREQLRI